MKLPTEFQPLRPEQDAECTLSLYLCVPVRDDAGCWSVQPVAKAAVPESMLDELWLLAKERARAGGRKVK